MKNIFISFIFVVISLSSTGILADGVPKSIKDGFVAYKADGPKSAIVTWIKGTSMEGSKEALSQANMFRQIEDYYGKYLGYDLFKSNPLGPKSNLYLFTINYERGVLFAKYFTYKSEENGEIVVNFKFHTEVDMVWPAYMVYGD